MAGLSFIDIIVIILLVAGVINGALRGIVQEALSLVALIAALAALRFLHEPVTRFLTEVTGNDFSAMLLALLLIVGVVWGGGKMVARRIGQRSRSSVIGPFDRLLGAGFGALKALLIAAMGVLALGLLLAVVAGGDRRAAQPGWLTVSRTYPLLRAIGDEVSVVLGDRFDRRLHIDRSEETGDRAGDAPTRTGPPGDAAR